MLALTDVAQIDVLDDYGLLIMLSGTDLFPYPCLTLASNYCLY